MRPANAQCVLVFVVAIVLVGSMLMWSDLRPTGEIGPLPGAFSRGGSRTAAGQAGCAGSGAANEPTYANFTVDTGAVSGAIGAGSTVTVPFYGTSFTLALQSYSVLAPGAVILIDWGNYTESIPATSVAGQGSVVGVPDSTAIVSVDGPYFDALVRVGNDWYFDSNIPGAPVYGAIHRGWKVTINSTTGGDQIGDQPPECPDGGGGGGNSIPVGPGTLSAPGIGTRGDGGIGPNHAAVLQQSLLISGDVEYWNTFWWCPFFLHIPRETCEVAQMTTEVARLNFIYNGIRVLGVRTPWVNFNIVAFDIHTPGTGNGGMTSFDPLTLLRQYRDHTLAAHAVPDYHAAHLLTGKDLNGNVIGFGGLNTENPQDPDQHAHWSLAQMVGAAGTIYGASDYARTWINSHEVGHTYTGAHAFAVHIRNCIWIFCWDYYTIMWPTYMGDQAMLPRFSDSVTDNRPPAQANRDRIHDESHVKPLR